MNFKKYHVSRNLLSEKYENRSINGVGAFVIDSNFDLWIGEVIAGQIYTISNMDVVYSFFTAKPLPNTGATYNGSRGYESSGTAVVTVPSGCTWIAVRVSHNADNAMLNTGSQPLPYEPYSSEVWHDTPHYIHKTDTDILTTLPADIYVNDTTATVGLKGQMSQTGTPTHDNPIMPQGTGERTGNLFNVNRLPSDTWTIDDKYYIDGTVGDNKSSIQPNTVDVSISNSGDLTVTARSYYGAGFVIPVTPNTTYTISFTTDMAVPSSKSKATITYVNADEDFLNLITIYGGTTSVTFTTPNTAYYILITFRYASNTITYSDIMLSSTALPYENFGYKIPISSANTTTPVYLGEVETTRKIKKLVFYGTEGWNEGTSNYYIFINVSGRGNGIPNSAALSTHTEGGVVVNNNGTALFFKKSVFVHSSLADFKSFLQQQYANGTPVTVWYVLAEPKTGIVNEPLMKIGDYADEVSGITIPTIAGANTISVDTTVQPSEVTVNYKGWHPVQSTHEHNNGAWT